MGGRADGSAGQWVGQQGGLFDEGPAVGKMAAAARPSWWQGWRRRAWARDGFRPLLLLLLLGSGQGPRHARAAQAVEYLKREHSLSKPYQGEAPRARWSRRGGQGTEPGDRLRRQRDGALLPPGSPAPSRSHRSQGQGSAPRRPFRALEVSSRSRQGSQMSPVSGSEEGEWGAGQESEGELGIKRDG